MADVQWRRCVLAGLGAFVASAGVVAVAVLIYAFYLAFKAAGAPDQGRIQTFAQHLGHLVGPAVRVVTTAAAAAWAARGSRSAVLQGVVVGVTAAVAGLPFGWPPGIRMAIIVAAVVAAGAAGAVVGQRPRPHE
jgi:hypothetical protein